MKVGRIAKALALGGLVALALPQTTASALPRSREAEPKPGEPGSGLGLDKQIRRTDPVRLKAPLPRRPRDETEAKGVEDIEDLAARYRAAHESMAHSIGQQLLVEGAEGKYRLDEMYTREIRDHEAKARKLRALAIRRYEDFLKLHPDDGTWSPEIMFRLAELHFEMSSERLARQEEAFQKELEAYQVRLEKDPNAQPPPGPVADYDEAIKGFRGVVVGFPNYRLGDAALYMMGTLLFEMESFDQSRQSYLALACANRFQPPASEADVATADEFSRGSYGDCTPWKEDSIYVAEAWLRIGEIHYDFDEFDPALEAYAQAASDPEGELYDEALIRMAWTLWLKRDFARAAEKFDAFIRYADKNKGLAKADGAVALRDEAVEYLAKTYIEDDWDGDGRADRLTAFARLDRDYRERGNERHVPEVYAALGDLYAFDTDYKRAIEIWEKILSRWPLTAAAPKIQLRIMEAHKLLQQPDKALAARDKLATDYLRGTDWFYANEDDPEAIEEALALAEEALVGTALDHHQRAQELRIAGDTQKAKQEYAIAARAYDAYLERFPDTPSSYEYRFNYAEALYYSDQHGRAAEQYSAVRDSNLDNRLQEDAADGAVASYEKLLEGHATAGTIVLPDMPKKGVSGPFDEQEIPDVVLALQNAYDRFVASVPDSDQAPDMKFLAGAISQRYYHFDEAQQRFEQILDDHCEENVAINAGTAIIDAHIVREDLKGVEKWTQQLLERGCGSGAEAEQFAGNLKSIGNAVIFQEALLLQEAGEYEAAADRYVALVKQAPADPNADKALNNAAVCYETIGRFQSASQTYQKIYQNYPDSEFADDALLREGYNHSRFFEFDAAVKSYLVLAEDQRYQDSPHRETALENAADLLDNLQEYDRSASFYVQFAEKTEDQGKASEAMFNAAEVLSKTDDHRATIRAYEAWAAKYGNQPANAARAVESNLRIGQAYAAMGDDKKAKAYYRSTISSFEIRGLKPATKEAALPAEAQFLLAEYLLRNIESTKLTGTGRKLTKQANALLQAMVEAAAEFDKVPAYRDIDWALAALYTRANVFEATAIRVREAPVPKSLKEYSESWFAYKDILDTQLIQPAEGKAIGLYQEVVKRGQQYGIVNEWTRRAQERLNVYMPEEFPLLRTPAMELQLEDLR